MYQTECAFREEVRRSIDVAGVFGAERERRVREAV